MTNQGVGPESKRVNNKTNQTRRPKVIEGYRRVGQTVAPILVGAEVRARRLPGLKVGNALFVEEDAYRQWVLKRFAVPSPEAG